MVRAARFAVLTAAWFAGVAGSPSAQVVQETDNRPVPSIHVSGTAEIRVVPDEVHLVIGLESRNKALDAAKAENDKAVSATMKFLKESGIESKDIQTDYINVRPEYENNSRSDREKFFVVGRTLGIRIRKVGDFETLLTGVLRSGANSVQGIHFQTTELRKHRDHARKLAVKAAREKAEALARDLGAKVGKPLVIREVSAPEWPGFSNLKVMNNAQNMAQGGAAGDGDNDLLAIGQISVSATVQVTFALEP